MYNNYRNNTDHKYYITFNTDTEVTELWEITTAEK